jgi:asparagine synthase (glutamine-hydrolysing)
LHTLQHRGPDGQGHFRDESVFFGHARLSIIDLSAAGHQPMHSADGRFVITYNGELYNFRELAKEYRLEGLRSTSDTEVLLRAFAQQGVGALPQLNGMFAFAIYDQQARKVWLVRDRIGIKPLFVQLRGDSLRFASEVKAILALDPGARACDTSALHEWLYYGNPLGGRTLYAAIRQLPPGHFLELDLDTFAHVIKPYWTLAESAHADVQCDAREAITETRRLLEQAVRRQLVSDVPVGVFLSGGVDSSAIVAFASRHYQGRLATYSVDFDFARNGGELPKAARVAARYGTDHHELHIRGATVGELVERLVRQHDMPFSDAANIPLYLMAAQIGAHTKVVLQGDGGDELFGGYRRYATLTYHAVLGRAARLLQRLQRAGVKSALQYRVRRYLRALAAEDPATVMALLLTTEDPYASPGAIFAPPVRERVERSDPFARHRECQQLFRGRELGNQMSMLDLLITLPDTYLEKVDRATMAASVEVRVPFLDHDLLDFVVRLPVRDKMPWGRKKWLLKSALRGVVPDEVLDGPKTGLEVPFGAWLQGALQPLFFDHLSSFARRHPEVLDIEYIRGLYAQTRAGQRNGSHMLWKVLNFMIWANTSNVDFQTAAAGQ